MTSESHEKAAIARTERGLTITGTGITLYDVMDYVKAQSIAVKFTSTKTSILLL